MKKRIRKKIEKKQYYAQERDTILKEIDSLGMSIFSLKNENEKLRKIATGNVYVYFGDERFKIGRDYHKSTIEVRPVEVINRYDKMDPEFKIQKEREIRRIICQAFSEYFFDNNIIKLQTQENRMTGGDIITAKIHFVL